MRRNKVVILTLISLIGLTLLLYSKGYRLRKESVIHDFESEVETLSLIDSQTINTRKELRLYEFEYGSGSCYTIASLERTGGLWRNEASEATCNRSKEDGDVFTDISYTNHKNQHVNLIYVNPGITPYREILDDTTDPLSTRMEPLAKLMDNIYQITYANQLTLYKDVNRVVSASLGTQGASEYWNEGTVMIAYQGKTRSYSDEEGKPGFAMAHSIGLTLDSDLVSQDSNSVLITVSLEDVFYSGSKPIEKRRRTTVVTYSKYNDHYLAKAISTEVDSDETEPLIQYTLVQPFIVEGLIALFD